VTDPKADAWMPLWIGAYMADTMTFTTAQHGAYLLLLMAYWRERCPLRDDDDELRSVTKSSAAEWLKLRPVLARKFRVADGVWWHKRVEAEIAVAEKRKSGAVAKAQAGGRALAAKRLKQAEEEASSGASSTQQAQLGVCPTPSPIPSASQSSEAKASAGGAGKSKVTDPDTIIFAYGVPLLTAAGSEDKHARSFLGGLRKHHGDEALVNALRDCIKAKPLQPLEWLAAALPPEKALDYKQPEKPWHQTRAGIQAKGTEFGIEPWDQAAWERGEREAWPQYEARVFAAAGHSPRAAA
jgi:uncharacterized protein YdaU (DUF1376 family)